MAGDQRQARAAAALMVGPGEGRVPGVEGTAGVADGHADDRVGEGKAHDDAGVAIRRPVLDDVGDPLLHHHGEAVRRFGREACADREAAGEPQGAGDRGRVGRKSRCGLGFGAELSYVLAPVASGLGAAAAGAWRAGARETGMRGPIIAALLMSAALSTTAAAAGQIGRIKSVAGAASLVRGKTVTRAAPGQLLQVSDVLKTGPDGRIGVTFVDNSRFALGPNTTIALSTFEFDDTTHAGQFLTTLNRGSLAGVTGQNAKENKDAMRVRTPTSVLAARGTRFVAQVR